MNFTKKQKTTIADVLIAFGILLLAFLLKDANSEAQTNGYLAVIAAIFLRFSGSKVFKCEHKTNK